MTKLFFPLEGAKYFPRFYKSKKNMKRSRTHFEDLSEIASSILTTDEQLDFSSQEIPDFLRLSRNPAEEKKSKTGKSKMKFKIGRNGNIVYLSPDCWRGYTRIGELGRGTTATVYEVAITDDRGKDEGRRVRPLAIKMQKLLTENELKTQSDPYYMERDFARKMSRLGIAPRFITSWECDGVGFIVTEKWDGSIVDLKVENISEILVAKLRKMIESMHRKGVIHGDLVDKNILVRLDPHTREVVDLTLGDFGLAEEIEDWKLLPPPYDEKKVINENLRRVKHMQVMHQYLSTYGPTNHYFDKNNIDVVHLLHDPRHLDYAYLYWLERGKGEYPL